MPRWSDGLGGRLLRRVHGQTENTDNNQHDDEPWRRPPVRRAPPGRARRGSSDAVGACPRERRDPSLVSMSTWAPERRSGSRTRRSGARGISVDAGPWRWSASCASTSLRSTPAWCGTASCTSSRRRAARSTCWTSTPRCRRCASSCRRRCRRRQSWASTSSSRSATRTTRGAGSGWARRPSTCPRCARRAPSRRASSTSRRGGPPAP